MPSQMRSTKCSVETSYRFRNQIVRAQKVAVALNEYLSEIGVSPFVPYIKDDTPTYLNASWSRSAALPALVSWCDQ